MNCLAKTLLSGIVCLFFTIFTTIVPAQSPASLTPAEWRKDLHYFQQLVHTKYPNLFYNISAAQFDSVVRSIDKRLDKLNDLQMRAEFVKLVALFQVGHTATRLRFGSDAQLQPWVHRIPAAFYLFSDGLYIKSIDKRYMQALGGKLTHIGKTDAMKAMEKIRPYVAFENEQGFKNTFPFYLSIPEFLKDAGIVEDLSQVPLTYVKNGREQTIVLKAEDLPSPGGNHGIESPRDWVNAYEQMNTEQSVLWLKKPARLRHFEYMPQAKLLYVRHSAVQNEPNETIADFFAKVFDFVDKNEVEKFVLDVRLNGGGNNYLNKPVITGIIAARKINQMGRLFIITGRETFSAAQNLVNELEKYTEAVFVGEPTSENVNFFGDTRLEVLPNSKLNINLSWLWWQNLDPRDKRKWKAPHLAADMSFEDYQKGIDPAMNLVLNYDKKGPIDNKLRDLVIQEKYDEAVSMAREYMQDPVHRYFKDELETKINDYGYQLINRQRFEQANKVLHMNVQLFPGSANVYDSYAESWWKLGNTAEAIKYYQIAIGKDPHGVTGDNARRMLAEIQGKKPM
ncbi:MAG TPA: hypothetical protein VFX58_01840 [Chitinophagaceae bacterium]|nr:hypothetical protein [Chitinophagaceae bacterium]